MDFTLVLNFANMTWYGNIPNTPLASDSTAEVFKLKETDRRLLLDDFAIPINSLCDTLLAYGDVDYFDAQKCVILQSWLIERLARPHSERLGVLYSKLLEFATRAIELNTGVVVEL